jgi:predicted DNA-binding transcriptional regulator AlpA
MLQKFYRRADAAGYLGMSTYTFDRQARPYLTDIPIGKQGVAFDRIEVDTWVDRHKAANGRPAQKDVYG